MNERYEQYFERLFVALNRQVEPRRENLQSMKLKQQLKMQGI